MRYLLAFLLLLGASYSATVHNQALKLFESVPVPDEWADIGIPDPDTELSLSILLRPEHPQLLEKTLYAVSTPGSHRYGQYLEQDAIKREILQPSEQSRKTVLDWLEHSGVKVTHDAGEQIQFLTTVGNANSMLGTRFRTYQKESEPSEKMIRTLEVRLPHGIIESIDLIHPTTYFDQIKPLRSTIHEASVLENAETAAPAQVGCSGGITPNCLAQLYDIKGFTIKDPRKTGRIGIPGFLGQIARFSDLAAFINSVPSRAKAGANFTSSVVNGGSMSQTSVANSMEANLDIQYTVGLTSPLHNHFYAVGGKGELVPDVDQPNVARGQNEPFAQFFHHLLNVEKNLPHTISISYAENEQNIPPTVSTAVCNQIAQLGIRGVSVLSGSGDWGVGSGCLTNDGQNKTWFTPIFPASCPYLTSVGGVTGTGPEQAVGFSSGGFSDRFPRPAYQESQVSNFIGKHGAKWAKYYNAKGRGFPDISAQAQGFRIVNRGKAGSIGGTSASTPVVASIFALVNAKRLQDGQPLLGFLNPWLYSVDTKVATDITRGKSTGCTGRSQLSFQSSGKVPGANWAAVEGWDPVTGIGTPKFSAMLQNLPIGKPSMRK